MIDSDEEINSKLSFFEKDMEDLTRFKNKLIDIYLLEFEENFYDILICDKNKYLNRFREKIQLILTDKYSDFAFESEDFLNLLKIVEQIFENNYYNVSYDFLQFKINNLKNKQNRNNRGSIVKKISSESRTLLNRLIYFFLIF